MDQFGLEVKKAVAHASTLRDNISAECVGLHEGGGGLVAKICFADGVCWADKMYANYHSRCVPRNGDYAPGPQLLPKHTNTGKQSMVSK